MNISYECKLCKKPGIVILPDVEAVTINIEKWKSMLTCNRCYDYREENKSCIDRIYKVCVALIALRQAPPKVEVMDRLQSCAREKLVSLTKLFASLVCEHHRKQNVWEMEFVNLIMENPEKFWGICRDYTNHIAT